MEVANFVELLEKHKPAGGGLFDNVIMITMNNQKMISVDDNNRDKISIDGNFIKIENDNYVYAMGYDFRPRKVVEYHDIFLIEGVVFGVEADDLLESKGFINDYNLECNKPTGGLDGRIFGMVKEGVLTSSPKPVIEFTNGPVIEVRIGEELPTDFFKVTVDGVELAADGYQLMRYGKINTQEIGIQTLMLQAIDKKTKLTSTIVSVLINVIDWVAPTVSLIGNATMYVEVGKPFTDPGVTATDPDGNPITPTVKGSVDTAVMGKYTITYSASYGLSAVTTVTRKVVVRDTTKPVITLNGDATMTVEINTVFTDPGVVVADNSAEDIQAMVTGTVDVTTLGTYTLRYDATDASGNSSEVNRTVEVVDTTKPVITLKGAKTMTIELDGTFTDPGATVTDNSKEVLTVSVSGATVDPTTIGTYKICYDATDSSGNHADQMIRTVNVVDSIIPVITLKGAKTMTVEVGGTFTDPGTTVTDNSGETLTVVVGGDTVDAARLGTYTVTYNATDSSGNKAEEITRTVNVVDTTAPVITLNGDVDIWIQVKPNATYKELGATVTDNSGEVIEAVIGGDVVDPTTKANYTVTYNATDSSGNKAVQVTRIVHVMDSTKPVITLKGAKTMTVDLDGTFTDPGATVTDNSGEVLDIIVSGDTVDVSVVADYTIRYNATDSSGNKAEEITRTVKVVDPTPVPDPVDPDPVDPAE